MKRVMLKVIVFLFSVSCIYAQEDVKDVLKKLEDKDNNLQHRLDVLEKKIDDVLWFERVGDVAFIDKCYIYGPPKWKDENETAMGYGNPVKFWSYVFIPKWIDLDKKYPLMVFPHGGVHADFTTYYTHIVREMLAQGYIVVAAEYRGSTGYGKGMYEKIDYGGLETEDVYASRNWMIENYDFIDSDRVGIMGMESWWNDYAS